MSLSQVGHLLETFPTFPSSKDVSINSYAAGVAQNHLKASISGGDVVILVCVILISLKQVAS